MKPKGHLQYPKDNCYRFFSFLTEARDSECGRNPGSSLPHSCLRCPYPTVGTEQPPMWLFLRGNLGKAIEGFWCFNFLLWIPPPRPSLLEVPVINWASLVAQLVKNPPAMQEPGLDPWVGKIPWIRERLLIPVFLPGEFHGQRSLAGYGPWGHRIKSNWVTSTFTFRFTENVSFLLDL